MRTVLSIDGGGVKGVFPAAFLASLQAHLDRPISTCFDLIVGTSTGGIIALGLGAGLTPSEIVGFYEKFGPQIFPRPALLRSIAGWLGARYEANPLRDALVQTFHDKLLGHSSCRLVIPSQNLETGAVHLFKTAHNARFVTDYLVSMVDVALATSAAPSYFPTHKLLAATALIDGGIWANNPVAVSAVEAIGVLGWPAEEVRILSIGCTSAPMTTSWASSFALGRIYWGAKLTEILTAGQSSGAMGMAQHLLGKPSVFRVNTSVAPGRFELDAAETIDALKGLGATAARTEIPNLNTFMNHRAEPFIPFHNPAS